MMFVFMFVLFLSTSNGFLLEKNNTGGSALTDQHYVHLLGLLTQEKENSKQMEQLVLKLNGEVKSLQMATLNNGNGSTQDITDLKNGYAALQKDFFQIIREINQVKNECSNSTKKLKMELETFTNSNSVGITKNMTQIQSSVESLGSKMDKTTMKLNSLISSSSALSQDFFALLNLTRDAQQKITILDSQTKQMEQLVLKLNGEVKSLQMATLNNGNGSTQDITDLKNGYAALQKDFIREINQVKNECSNSTKKLKMELETFTNSNSVGITKNMTQIQSSVESLESKMDKTTMKLNSLISSSSALSQDFFVLLNLTRDAQQKITILDSQTKQSLQSTNQKLTQTQHNLQQNQNSMNQKFTTLQTDFQGYQNSANQKFTTLQTDFHGTNQKFTSLQTHFHGYQTSTNQKINEAFQKITSINQTVVMTFCGGGTTLVSFGSVVKFTNPKTIYGISDVNAFKSSGKFTCEVGGVYLFSVFIMSGTNPSEYQMYKNNDVIAHVFIVSGTNNGYNYHTGTGIVAVSLNVGDTLYVQAIYDMQVHYGYSCMTVIKIR